MNIHAFDACYLHSGQAFDLAFSIPCKPHVFRSYMKASGWMVPGCAWFHLFQLECFGLYILLESDTVSKGDSWWMLVGISGSTPCTVEVYPYNNREV